MHRSPVRRMRAHAADRAPRSLRWRPDRVTVLASAFLVSWRYPRRKRDLQWYGLTSQGVGLSGNGGICLVFNVWPADLRPAASAAPTAAARGRRPPAAAEAGALAGADPAAIGPALQGVAAAHHAGVGPGHGPRPGPHPQLTVIPGPAQVTLVAQAGFSRAVRAERIRVPHYLAALGAGPHHRHLARHRSQGPAAEPP